MTQDSDAEYIKNDDLRNSNDNEDAEIMKSIAAAEKIHGHKMATPQKVAKESWQPVKYDVEDVQIGHGLIQGLIDSANDNIEMKIENIGSAAPIMHTEQELKKR